MVLTADRCLNWLPKPGAALVHISHLDIVVYSQADTECLM